MFGSASLQHKTVSICIFLSNLIMINATQLHVYVGYYLSKGSINITLAMIIIIIIIQSMSIDIYSILVINLADMRL